MAEYIDREKALEEFEEWVGCTWYLPRGTSYYYECRGCIEDVPAADVVEAKHGKWKLVKNKVKCSCCQKDAFSVSQTCYKNDKKIIEKTFIHTPYCPHCGAKMDGGNNA